MAIVSTDVFKNLTIEKHFSRAFIPLSFGFFIITPVYTSEKVLMKITFHDKKLTKTPLANFLIYYF